MQALAQQRGLGPATRGDVLHDAQHVGRRAPARQRELDQPGGGDAPARLAVGADEPHLRARLGLGVAQEAGEPAAGRAAVLRVDEVVQRVVAKPVGRVAGERRRGRVRLQDRGAALGRVEDQHGDRRGAERESEALLGVGQAGLGRDLLADVLRDAHEAGAVAGRRDRHLRDQACPVRADQRPAARRTQPTPCELGQQRPRPVRRSRARGPPAPPAPTGPPAALPIIASGVVAQDPCRAAVEHGDRPGVVGPDDDLQRGGVHEVRQAVPGLADLPLGLPRPGHVPHGEDRPAAGGVVDAARHGRGRGAQVAGVVWRRARRARRPPAPRRRGRPPASVSAIGRRRAVRAKLVEPLDPPVVRGIAQQPPGRGVAVHRRPVPAVDHDRVRRRLDDGVQQVGLALGLALRLLGRRPRAVPLLVAERERERDGGGDAHQGLGEERRLVRVGHGERAQAEQRAPHDHRAGDQRVHPAGVGAVALGHDDAHRKEQEGRRRRAHGAEEHQVDGRRGQHGAGGLDQLSRSAVAQTRTGRVAEHECRDAHDEDPDRVPRDPLADHRGRRGVVDRGEGGPGDQRCECRGDQGRERAGDQVRRTAHPQRLATEPALHGVRDLAPHHRLERVGDAERGADHEGPLPVTPLSTPASTASSTLATAVCRWPRARATHSTPMPAAGQISASPVSSIRVARPTSTAAVKSAAMATWSSQRR